MSSDEALIRAARDVRARAYAPYSKFQVGAALLATDGSTFLGVNVENCAYPTSLCAERSALVSAVTAGQRQFTTIAIVTELDDHGSPGSPCGSCRQALAEFGLDLRVLLTGPRDDAPVVATTLRELLPKAFTPDNL